MKMLRGVLGHQLPVFLADMGRQSGARHGGEAQRRVLCPAVDVVDDRFLSVPGFHAADGIATIGPFNQLRTLTLLWAGWGGIPGPS